MGNSYRSCFLDGNPLHNLRMALWGPMDLPVDYIAMIHGWFCALDAIYHTAFNLKARCQMHFIAHVYLHSEVHSWFHSIAHSQPALLYAPNCSRWHTPILLDLCSQVYLQVHSPEHSWACSQRRSQLHSMAHSQPVWLYAPKYAVKTLSSILPIALDDTLPVCLTIRIQGSAQDTPKNTEYAPKYTSKSLSSTLPSTLSSTLLIALDGTLPACLTVRSQISSQNALKHTLKHVLKYTSNCTGWSTPCLLDCMLPS
jgi:hypothetical protein